MEIYLMINCELNSKRLCLGYEACNEKKTFLKEKYTLYYEGKKTITTMLRFERFFLDKKGEIGKKRLNS